MAFAIASVELTRRTVLVSLSIFAEMQQRPAWENAYLFPFLAMSATVSVGLAIVAQGIFTRNIKRIVRAAILVPAAIVLLFAIALIGFSLLHD
ncbi:hypothetical protein [Neorhodopirellula lusitana]|uniref:hypothetical protein n=1 Tax=Neorhodopirellula lusitana TaxID=445327 RepID=UPI0024B68284|nr:hypothetical protein [Neorhodopirellula lusitana]